MKKIATFGEIMFRISPKNIEKKIVQTNNFNIEPAGSESNVAITLKKLKNKNVEFITKIPNNFYKEIILNYLKKYEINTSNIIFEGDKIGLLWTEKGFGPRSSKVFYDRKNSSFSNLKKNDVDWGNISKNISWFHTSGITPSLSENIFDILHKFLFEYHYNFIFSFDLNYRKNLWNYVQNKKDVYNKMNKICKYSEVIISNENELCNSLGIKGNFEQSAKKVFKKFPKLKYLAINKRKSFSANRNILTGIIFYKKENKIIYKKGPEYDIFNIVDRIGSGDCFASSIINCILNDYDIQDTIDISVALFALKHTILGDICEFDQNDIDDFLNFNKGNIIR